MVWKEDGKVLSSWEISNWKARVMRIPGNRNGNADPKRRLAALKAWETMRRRRSGK